MLTADTWLPAPQPRFSRASTIPSLALYSLRLKIRRAGGRIQHFTFITVDHALIGSVSPRLGPQQQDVG